MKVTPGEFFDTCFDHGREHMATLERLLRAFKQYEQLSEDAKAAIFGTIVKIAIFEGLFVLKNMERKPFDISALVGLGSDPITSDCFRKWIKERGGRFL